MKHLLLLIHLVLFGSAAWAKEDISGWYFNFTPAVVVEKGYNPGGGIDPELRYHFGSRSVAVSLGARAGSYYAKNLGVQMAMPTLRLTLPNNSFDTYAAFGYGRGWIPDLHFSDTATISRLGFVFHFTRLDLGVEGTYHQVYNSDFQFLSLGSMISFRL